MNARGIQLQSRSKRPSRALRVLSVAVAALPWETATAQRGYDYVQQEIPAEGLSSGFPGFLDTEVAGLGSLLLEASAVGTRKAAAPNLGLDYGLTEHLTVGTSLASPLLMAAGIANLYVKFRYRMYATGNTVVALTFHGGAFEAAQAGSSLQIRPKFGMASVNASYRFSERLTGLGHVLGFQAALENGAAGSVDAYEMRMSALAIGAGAQFRFLGRLRLQLDLLHPLYGNYSEDRATYTGVTSPDLLSLGGGNITYRTGLDYRISDAWLASAGSYGARIAGTFVALPFGSVAVLL